MGGLANLRTSYQALGPLRFWLLLGGTILACVGFGIAHWWLAERIGWPDAYGFHCRGRGCLWREWFHSPLLLKSPNPYGLLLFALLWSVPAIVASTAVFVWLKRWLHRHRTRIRSLDPR